MKNHQTVAVWDIFVRSFHWLLIVLVGIAFLTGDDDSLIHVYAGYAILLLIALRLIWGMIGSKYARFVNFICTPTAALDYLKGMLRGISRRHLGHNPAAAWMIMVLIVLLLLVNATGYLLNRSKVQGQKPLPVAFCLLSARLGLMTMIMVGIIENLLLVSSGKSCTKSAPVFCWG